jgi:hypothetical protein
MQRLYIKVPEPSDCEPEPIAHSASKGNQSSETIWLFLNIGNFKQNLSVGVLRDGSGKLDARAHRSSGILHSATGPALAPDLRLD